MTNFTFRPETQKEEKDPGSHSLCIGSQCSGRYFQTSDQMKVLIQFTVRYYYFCHFLSKNIYFKLYIFAFFLRLGEWCHAFSRSAHSCVGLYSDTNNMEGGERFCSWKYSHYFELLKKVQNTMLDQGPGPARPGPTRPEDSRVRLGLRQRI